MADRTTGPLYVEYRYRNGEHRFALLLSNITAGSLDVDVTQYAAPFTAIDTPETWTSIMTRTVTIPAYTVANLVLFIPQSFPYYQFEIETVGDVRPSLYLMNNLRDAVQDFPLVPTADWEIVEP